MERNLKRLSLALIALGLSAPAFADNCVMVPSQQGGFKVGIDALYLRPGNSDLNYATIIPIASLEPDLSRSQHNVAVDPSYDWGFYAQIGYLFPCTGNDLTVGYTYLRQDESDHVAVGPFTVGPNGAGPYLYLQPAAADAQSAAAKSKLNLNVVDLEGGQRFTTGAYDMRMFAGLRYASLNSSLASIGFPYAPGQGPNTAETYAQKFKSDFKGIGPRLGVDARYCLNSGFGVDANLSTALLVGNVDSNYRAIDLDVNGNVNQQHVKNNSHDRVVPVLEAKLGVDYTHIIDCRCKSSIVFEAGYQVTNYFNAVDRPRIIDDITGFQTSQNSTSDYALDGPYFGVKYYA